MHDTADHAGKLFLETYRTPATESVLDIGSQDVNGSLRRHARNLRYVGLDIAEAKGVDVVCPPGEPFPFADDAFDIAVSTSCFEHDPCFWVTFLEAIRVIKPGGYFYYNAPSNGPYHGYPFDNWRFYPDAGLALVAWAKRNSVDVRMVESGTLKQGKDGWNDFVAVFQKAPFSERTDFVLDAFPDAMNVRRAARQDMGNFGARTEDVERLAKTRQDAEREIASLRRETERLRNALQAEVGRAESLRAQLTAVLSSRAWRITKPLRVAKEYLSRELPN